MTIHHDLFEHVSSHITLDEIMYTEMNNQCPDEPQAEENCVLSVKINVYLILKGSLKSVQTLDQNKIVASLITKYPPFSPVKLSG